MYKKYAPIALFAYRRPDHTLKTLESLQLNDLAGQSELFVFSDGPRADASSQDFENIKNVREIIRSKRWCGKVTLLESEVNKGLTKSVTEGVSKIVNEYGKVIVLEDDLNASAVFLNFMNSALEKYENEEKVMQVSGFSFPFANAGGPSVSYFLPLACTWGWGTWKRAWDKLDKAVTGYEKLKTDTRLRMSFDLDGAYPYTSMLLKQVEEKSISSWGIVWQWSVFINKGLVLYPGTSLIRNEGYGQEATHTKSENPFNEPVIASENGTIIFPEKIAEDSYRFKELKEFLRGIYGNSTSMKRWFVKPFELLFRR